MNFQSVLTAQQHQYAIMQRRSNTPQNQRQQHSSSTTNGGASSLSGSGSMSPPQQHHSTGGSFVTKIRQAPAKAGSSNSSSTSSDSTPTATPTTKGGLNTLLTQAPSTLGNNNNNNNNNKGSINRDRQHGERDNAVEPLVSGKWSVNERRLAQWQQQPYNLSPATHLNLEPMLPPARPDMKHRPLLVLDVDETLVHASFTPAKPFHVKITIHVDGESGDIFVAYRPHLFTFLDAILPLFEVAIFTASQSCYADQLLDAIDPQGRLGRLRLFREHCTEVNGARVKDLSLLGRPLHRIALIDNSPVTYLFQPRNAIPILSWFDDPRDTELLKLLPMLRQMAQAPAVYDVLDLWNCSQR